MTDAFLAELLIFFSRTVVMIVDIIQCPHGLVVGEYEKIIFYWPSLLCKVFLLGRFAYIFVQALRVRLQMDLNQEETSFLELHQAQYVQQLMKKPPTEQPPKSWIQQKVYEWDPLFQFPCRMICMGVLAMICLYMFIVMEYYVYKLVSNVLKTLGTDFEKLAASSNISSNVPQVVARIQSLEEFIDVTEGYLIIHVVQCLFGVLLMYSFVLPVKNGQGVEMVLIAARFFLQPKILENDKEKPLALDNRRGFQNFNYFFFFYNVLLGLGSCLFRLLSSIVVGAWLIARIDRTIMPKGYEALDMGFRTWIGMLFLDHYHTNPTLICFCHILVLKARERPQQGSTYYQHFNNATEKIAFTKTCSIYKTNYILHPATGGCGGGWITVALMLGSPLYWSQQGIEEIQDKMAAALYPSK
ncbi:Stimulated by retinoic acid gene 6 protein-like [Varanus komodoensis]|nr:Stimulated by retinoic acid gene 6 protein-like [Varanus komodoensis]